MRSSSEPRIQTRDTLSGPGVVWSLGAQRPRSHGIGSGQQVAFSHSVAALSVRALGGLFGAMCHRLSVKALGPHFLICEVGECGGIPALCVQADATWLVLRNPARPRGRPLTPLLRGSAASSPTPLFLPACVCVCGFRIILQQVRAPLCPLAVPRPVRPCWRLLAHCLCAQWAGSPGLVCRCLGRRW